MTQLSLKAKYALRALYWLATPGAAAPIRAKDLAANARVPHKFLETILLELKHAGILESRRGKGGGYVLGKAATEISVGDVVRLIDGPLTPVPCLAGASTRCESCPGDAACRTRRVMARVARAVASILDNTPIAPRNKRERARSASPAGGAVVSFKLDT
jgi:Rrf2 family protein